MFTQSHKVPCMPSCVNGYCSDLDTDEGSGERECICDQGWDGERCDERKLLLPVHITLLILNIIS